MIESNRTIFAREIERAMDEWCATEFKWGLSDCMLSVMDIVQRTAGYDPAHAFRGRYASEFTASKVLQPFGGLANALQSVADEFGWKEVEPQTALVGDIGLVRSAGLSRAGVIKAASNRWMGRRKPTGITALTDAQIVRAWSVA